MREINRVLELLRTTPPTVDALTAAHNILIANGMRPIDVELAIRHLKGGDAELALKYLYGPTNRGTGRGAIKDLEIIASLHD
ncbi:MAG: hypothetical protein WC565_03295 [Parcubacteria group bacterium]